MSYSLLVRPEAEADLEEAARWYERQREGLGADFLLCVDEVLAKISRSPLVYPVVHKDVRRGMIRRFPYGIFYRLVENYIVVMAVFHARRDPRRWQSRG
jgi:toxin ParE1/3/4